MVICSETKVIIYLMASAVVPRYLTSCCRNCWRSHASSRGGDSRVDVMSSLADVLWKTNKWCKEESSSVHLFWDLAEPQLLMLVPASNNTLVTLSHWGHQTEPPIYWETHRELLPSLLLVLSVPHVLRGITALSPVICTTTSYCLLWKTEL